MLARLATVLLATIIVAGCGSPTSPAGGGADASQAAPPAWMPSLAWGFVPQDAGGDNPGTIGEFLTDPEEGPLPGPETTPVLAGDLPLGAPSASVMEGSIAVAGGTFTATFDDGAISFAAPDSAFAADAQISVGETPIGALDANAYGGILTPATPLYTIDVGGNEPLLPVTVTLAYTSPAGAPADSVAMAFSFDSANGQVTPLTPLSSDGTSVRALATHFSAIFGAIVDMAMLPAIVDSGFRPGVDDWQFPNYGSYAVPKGHCEGQALSAIWYFNTQRRAAGASPLYGLYDNNGAVEKTPAFWKDDSQGYRLASAVQASAKSNRFTNSFFRNLGFAATSKQLIYDAFRLAIAFTGQPQLIDIWNADNTAGHAMIVYRVSNQRIYVADPNYPRALRTIAFNAATGDLGPYSSGDSVASIVSGNSVSYTRFAYVPAESSAGSAAIASNWSDLEANKAGDAVFPGIELFVSTETDDTGEKIWEPLPNGYVSPTDSIDIGLGKLTDGSVSTMWIYPIGTTIPIGDWSPTQTVALNPGDNQLGVLVYGKRDGKWNYVDFVRLTVTSAPTPSAEASSQAPDPVGAVWVLTSSAGFTATPDDPDTSAVGYSFEKKSGSLSGSFWHSDESGARLTANDAVVWNEPPAQATPGDTWQTPLHRTATCDPFAWFDVSLVTRHQRDQATLVQQAQDACEPIDGLTATFTYPDGDPDALTDTLEIEVALGLNANSAHWVYTYTWQP
jgi:hypothetical protein